MSDPRNDLQNMFDPSNRYANFGNVIMNLHAQGFRCHTDTVIEIDSPITAFCGLNGTGKSTLLHLAAAAYKSNDGVLKYYIKDFIVVGTLDPTPFTDNATVEYKFWQEDGSLRSLKLSRNSKNKRWEGYRRRIERFVHFAGIGLYLPKIEQRDFIVRKAHQLIISDPTPVSERLRQWTSTILGYDYGSIKSNKVRYSHQSGQVLVVERTGREYSEAHMGYGEGRSLYIINILETLPQRSLVLIEEPETSLHPSAQYQFGKYLVDVAKTKRHQILLTTHSEYLLDALPSQSLIYLHKTETGIKPIYRLTSARAKSLMTEGLHKALCILVEDACAQAILAEIIRREDHHFLRSVGIYPGGSKETIAQTVRTLKNTGLTIAAVRDADKESSPKENIFKLPGSLAPEKEILRNNGVKNHFQSSYGISIDDFQSRLTNDHHRWFEELAKSVCREESALVGELATIYVGSLPESERSNLVMLLKEASRK
jgi:predicted ATPase